MSNKKQKYLVQEAESNKKKRPAPTYQEAKRYMLITWACTVAVGFMVFGRLGATGKPPTALHYILLGILVIVSLAMTEGFIKANLARKDEDSPSGKRSKG